MTQTDRVLRALKLAGKTGVTALDFIREPTFDGGPPITRVAARIEELRNKHGHNISSSGTRNGCAVYVLREVVPIPPPPIEVAVGEELLFDPRGLSKPKGAYDDVEAA